MVDISFRAGIETQVNDLKKSATGDALQISILSAHEKYFHENSGNHAHEESALYHCVIKYFDSVA